MIDITRNNFNSKENEELWKNFGGWEVLEGYDLALFDLNTEGDHTDLLLPFELDSALTKATQQLITEELNPENYYIYEVPMWGENETVIAISNKNKEVNEVFDLVVKREEKENRILMGYFEFFNSSDFKTIHETIQFNQNNEEIN